MSAAIVPMLAVHGGAGVIERSEMTPRIERAYRDVIR
jgi:hypothetical protein